MIMKKIIAACSMIIISFVMIAQTNNSQSTRDIRNYSDKYSNDQIIELYENFYGVSLNPSVVQHNPMYLDNDLIRIGLPSSKIIKRINKKIKKQSKEIIKREKRAIKKWEKQHKKTRKEREKRIEKIEKRDKKARKQWEKENKKIRKEREKRMKKMGKW